MSQDTYTCQQCRQPLILDPSLSSLTSKQHDHLLDLLPSEPSSSLSFQEKLARVKASKESKEAYLDGTEREGRGSNTRRGTNNIAESFILLGGEGGTGGIPAPRIKPSQSSRARTETSSESEKQQGPSSLVHLPTSLLTALSSKTAIDHPLCSECARLLQETLQSKLEDLQRERDAYIGFEKEWSERLKAKRGRVSSSSGKRVEGYGGDDEKGRGKGKEAPLDDGEYEEMVERKRELEMEKVRLMKELDDAEEEERRLEQEEKVLRAEEEALQKEEEDFLHSYHEAQANDLHVRQSLQTEKTHLLLASQTLARLESTNVYNDIFQIGHVPLIPPAGTTSSTATASGSGSGNQTHAEQMKRAAAAASTNAMLAATTGTGQTVGTINGLRLGGRPWVDWVEINAALGLVALSIDRMAVKVGCTFQTYKILPLGSFSRIDELPPSKNSYELYASTDISAARFLQNRRFNYALVGMLDCLRQLVEYQRARSRGWGGSGLDIVKDRIAGHSIKLNANMGMSSIGLGGTSSSTEAEESWTKALRAVLAVLKRILVIESEADREALRGVA